MSIPELPIDLFSNDSIYHPYENYRQIRECAPVVRLPATGIYAIGRYGDVRACLTHHDNFLSEQGVGVNEIANRNIRGTTIASDSPKHEQLRRVIAAPLQPAALASLRDQIETAAQELIERLVARGAIDGILDLARFLPVSIVSNLVGLPEQGREKMLDWAAAAFDSLGPMTARSEHCFQRIGELIGYLSSEAGSHQVAAGSWAAAIYAAADRGDITREECLPLILDYVGPSLDTTINATGHLLFNLGKNPAQWDLLRAQPQLISAAINEAIRFESPIRGFTRFAAKTQSIDGLELQGGSRVLLLFASANRDDRYWEAPDRFDIERPRVATHLGFGYGRHSCAGMHLARLEISSLLKAMIKRVSRIEVGEPVLALNSLLRGYESLPITLHSVN
jgi:cytochrome P450